MREYDITDVHAFGERIGKQVKGGEIFELVGDVGAGKTTLTKAIAFGMGIRVTVQSPTYTITTQYDAPSGLRLAHYDFYRLQDAGIMKDELMETVQDTTTVTVIEWGEIVNDVLPRDHVRIRLTATSESVRSIVVESGGDKSKLFVAHIA